MKSCPTCNRTFEDTFTFCLIDGSILSAPFAPETGKSAPPARDTSPPRTEVLTSAAVEPEPLPHTQAATPTPHLQPTITAPPPAAPAFPRDEPSTGRLTTANQSKIVRNILIAIAIAVAVVIAVVVFLSLMIRPGSPNRNRNSVNGPSNALAVPSNTANTTASSTSGASSLQEAMAKQEATVREQLRADPDNPRLNTKLGQILSYEGQYSESETLLRKAIRLDPSASAPHYILAVVFKEQNKTVESQAERKKADELASKGQ